MKNHKIFFELVVSLFVSVVIFSQTIPQTINYHGILKDASGVVVANGDYNLTFKLYDVASGGSALWMETKMISVVHGIINTQLGSVTPIVLPFDAEYWLGVIVASESEMVPRVKLNSVPYSFMTMNVMDESISSSKLQEGAVTTDKINDQSVTQSKLASDVSLPPGGNAGGDLSGSYPNPTVNRIRGRQVSNITPTSGQVLGWSGSTWEPVSQTLSLPFSGQLNNTGTTALKITHSATTGTNYGIYSTISSSSGRAIYGRAPTYGIEGAATNSSGIADGLRGISYSTGGTGVFGGITATTGTNYGGYFTTPSTSGRGVMGTTTSSTGSCYGVAGVSNSSTGHGVHGESNYIGVYGLATTTSGYNYGVRGETNSSNGYGVLGRGKVYGVYAWVTNTLGDRYAMYAYAAGDGGPGQYAGWFSGHVMVTRLVNKGGGSFKIDHPLDPRNKYLYHSFVESPDMMNIYNGNVITDGAGYAIVDLPDWFEALNKEFRYQLTVIGDFAQAIISKKIRNNQFAIRTDKPNIEVSWQVTGIRHDAFAEKYRIRVEENKKGEEVGKYLHPEAFGLSEDYSIDAMRNKKLREEINRSESTISNSNSTSERELNSNGEIVK